MQRLLFILLTLFVPFALTAFTHQANMTNFAFESDSLSVNQGDSVLWVNVSTGFHTTTSGVSGVSDGYWDSGLISPGDSFAFEFDSVGTYPYYCTPHWQLGMVGVIFVNPVGVEEFGKEGTIQVVIDRISSNPFRNKTDITFSIMHPDRMIHSSYGTARRALNVYEATGRLVKSLRLSPDALRHTLSWDGRNDDGGELPNGVYIYQIRLLGNVVNEKIIKVK